jgi:hypothetical protein
MAKDGDDEKASGSTPIVVSAGACYAAMLGPLALLCAIGVTVAISTLYPWRCRQWLDPLA